MHTRWQSTAIGRSLTWQTSNTVTHTSPTGQLLPDLLSLEHDNGLSRHQLTDHVAVER